VIGDRDEGIVLRHLDKRVSLLSRGSGRIDVLRFSSHGPSILSCGALISYSWKQGNRGWKILQNDSLEYLPLVLARHDIYFLHYLLELCYFFIPVGSGGHTIFLLLKQVYQNFQAFEQLKDKKIVICKFLAHLGVCPEDPTIQSYTQIFLEVPIDNIGITNLELVLEDVLDEWLAWCIYSHPHGKWFKAMPSLIKSENP